MRYFDVVAKQLPDHAAVILERHYQHIAYQVSRHLGIQRVWLNDRIVMPTRASSILNGAFIWDRTPEGSAYWEALFVRCLHQETFS